MSYVPFFFLTRHGCCTLSLHSNNRIPPEGAIHLAMGLKHNKTIRILQVSRLKSNFGGSVDKTGQINGSLYFTVLISVVADTI